MQPSVCFFNWMTCHTRHNWTISPLYVSVDALSNRFYYWTFWLVAEEWFFSNVHSPMYDQCASLTEWLVTYVRVEKILAPYTSTGVSSNSRIGWIIIIKSVVWILPLTMYILGLQVRWLLTFNFNAFYFKSLTYSLIFPPALLNNSFADSRLTMSDFIDSCNIFIVIIRYFQANIYCCNFCTV